MQLSWLIRGLRSGVVTTRYPRGPIELPPGFHGMPALDVDRCQAASGCEACQRACLPQAITIESLRESGTSKRFNLNYGRCIICGLCVSACPNQAMSMIGQVELSVRHPNDLVFVTDLDGKGAAADVPGTTSLIRENGHRSRGDERTT
jgi:formate hydrogenlyase subunit 6/NADH:ubiquinone oxidoreductase subunit I